jgi:plasmid stability protein
MVLHCFTCRQKGTVMETRNITLSLPEETLREVKVLAARKGTSVSALLSQTLTDLLTNESGYAAARERNLAGFGRGRDLGTGGEIGWDRDELHER